jgi:hypothetical protein
MQEKISDATFEKFIELLRANRDNIIGNPMMKRGHTTVYDGPLDTYCLNVPDQEITLTIRLRLPLKEV